MNMTDSVAPGEGPLRAAVRGWDRFWFHPADPTLLGAIRILAGLLALYVHFAYTYDLLDFVGKDAWISAETMDDFRKEAPTYDRPDGWGEGIGEEIIQRRTGMPPLTPEQIRFMERWDGNDPRFAARSGYFAWSIWYHVTDPTWIRVVHGAVLVIFFMLTIGLCTRVVSVLAWLAALSYIQRHYTAFFGMDTIMVFVLLYLMIGPSGAALSVDRLILRFAHAWRALRARSSARKSGTLAAEALRKAEGLELDRPAPSAWANLALRLIQIHVCIVYLASGTSKLSGNAWWNGTAIWGTMVNPEFSPVHSSLYMGAIRFLCEHRWLWELFTSGGALFTLVFEIGFAFLIWNRWLRWTMIVSAVMLHTGIAFFMGLTTFSLIMIVAVTSFTPPEALARFLRWLTRGHDSFQFGYAARDRRQVRAACLVRAADVWNQVQLRDHAALHAEVETRGAIRDSLPAPAPEEPLQMVTEGGNVLTGYGLFERLTRSIRLLWPLGALTFIPGVAAVGRGWFPERNVTRPFPVKDAHIKARGETVAH